jgi:hypothetical protein
VDNPARADDPRLAAYAANSALLQARLDQVWRALQREPELRGLADWIESDQVSAADAGDVVISATLRVLRNPDGAEEESSSIDDYTERTKRADATEDVYFTAAEKRRLAPPVYTAGSMSFTDFRHHRRHPFRWNGPC